MRMPTYYIGLTVLTTRQCGGDYLISEKESLIIIDPDDGIALSCCGEYGDPVKHI